MSNLVDCNFSQTGEGPGLFLIHGIGAAEDAWRFILPKLSESFTVITYDLRGHGKSSISNKNFNLDDLVLDLERIREETKIKKAHFIGHSLGGMIAPAYAKKFPDNIISLGLLSTVAARSPEEKNKVLEEQSEKQRFSTLNPDDDYRKGTLGKALGNTQQAITKAYVDSIIETAEIQEIMRALDNIPGIQMLGRLIASFKCPNTHFLYPSIDSFLNTLSFDPCGPEPTDLRLPSIQQIPNLSWDLIGNLVKAFIYVFIEH